uniref:Uncharacterized protein n=1 Tax=Timema poppense TaxID=170557 RepID=A0A7R9D3Q4_TIMPO|nr:unnamed protein product [Timema poppensis]
MWITNDRSVLEARSPTSSMFEYNANLMPPGGSETQIYNSRRKQLIKCRASAARQVEAITIVIKSLTMKDRRGLLLVLLRCAILAPSAHMAATITATGRILSTQDYHPTEELQHEYFDMDQNLDLTDAEIPGETSTTLAYIVTASTETPPTPSPKFRTSEPEDLLSEIEAMLRDRYVRGPVAVIVDQSASALNKAREIWSDVIGNTTSFGVNLLLLTYAKTDVVPVLKPKNLSEFKRLLREVPAVSTMGGIAFTSLLKASEQIPFDGEVLLFAGTRATDENIAQLAADTLLKKRCKLHVIWCGPSLRNGQGVEVMYHEVAHHTGGGLHANLITNLQDEDNKLKEVILAVRRGLVGHSTLDFQVDSSVRALKLTVEGRVDKVVLSQPSGGRAVDLLSDEDMRNWEAGSATLEKTPTLLAVRLNTGSDATGTWTLALASERGEAQGRYDVTVRAASPLGFTTTLLDGAHSNKVGSESTVKWLKLKKTSQAERPLDERRRRARCMYTRMNGVVTPIRMVERSASQPPWKLVDVCDPGPFLTDTHYSLGYPVRRRRAGNSSTLRVKLLGGIGNVSAVNVVDGNGKEVSKLSYLRQSGSSILQVPADTLPLEPFYLQVIGQDARVLTEEEVTSEAKAYLELPSHSSDDVISSSHFSLFSLLPSPNVTGDRFQRVSYLSPQTSQLGSSQASPLGLEVGLNSTLAGLPGQTFQVTFTVTNYQTISITSFFSCQAQKVRILNIQPLSAIITPKQTVNVALLVSVPQSVVTGTTDVVTFTATLNSASGISKAAYLYIGTQTYDNKKPSLSYTFNNKCDNTNEDNCQSKVWGVDIIVQDDTSVMDKGIRVACEEAGGAQMDNVNVRALLYASGLLQVTSQPRGIQFHSTFIAGMKDTITAKYSATCCNPKVDIYAYDIQGNYIRESINVKANSGGLKTGEIAAIVLGILLLIALILFIVFLVKYCKKKRSASFPQQTAR